MVKIVTPLLLVIVSSVVTYVLFAGDTIVAQAPKPDLAYINPAVQANLGKHYIINFQPLRETFIAIDKKHAGQGYIYFAYLNNAAWVGINEREMITAASTVKVPLAMAVYKNIEEGRFTGEELYTIEEDDLNAGFGELYKAGAGQTITLRELVEIMLVYSDNTASNAIADIFRRVGIENPLDEVYAAMGWDAVSSLGEVPSYGLIHLKVLSNMFTALYNATYLNAEHSQVVLSHLAQTPFRDKLEAGVPKGVAVSHKIGTYAESKTYSDCGIIYAPSRNYLLCVASVGVDEPAAARFMAEVSAAAYEYVIKH